MICHKCGGGNGMVGTTVFTCACPQMLADAETGFHWRDGWYFKRSDNGAVRVSHVIGYPNKQLEQQFSIPENEWASIVSSVSKLGETWDRWHEIRMFHGLIPGAEPK